MYITAIKNNFNIGQSFKGNLLDRSVKSQADSFLSNGNFDKAIAIYQRLLVNSPKDSSILLNLAKAHNYNNAPNLSIPYLTTYLEQNPDDVENITLLGECCKKSGMFSTSIRYFEKALSIEPNYDYAKRNLLDAQNLLLACVDPEKARQEKYDTAIKNLTEAVKIAKSFLPKGYTNDMKDIIVSFDKTAKMGGRSNIAQYEHSKRKISVTDEYTYADPRLTGAYLIHEFVHGKDNDPYTSVREEQDAYRAQAQYWVNHVRDVYDPEMDYVADLYKESVKTLDDRVAEIYRLRDSSIPETSYNHPPTGKKQMNKQLALGQIKPLQAYDIIV